MQSADERMRPDATGALNRTREWSVFVERSVRLRWGPVRLHDHPSKIPRLVQMPMHQMIQMQRCSFGDSPARSSDHNAASCPEVPLGRRHEYLAEANLHPLAS